MAAAKAKPGGLNFGSPGLGTIPHLSMAELSQISKVEFNHVPFKGPAEAIQMALAGQNHGPPRRPNSWVDDHHVHRAGREVRVGLRNGQRAVQNVERLHRMADVDDLRLGSNLQDDPLHGADEMIVESEISGESDDCGACQSDTSWNL